MVTKEKMGSSEKASKKKVLSAEEMRCAKCGIRRMSEANPRAFMSRVWKWHTGWCPGWQAYQKALAEAAE